MTMSNELDPVPVDRRVQLQSDLAELRNVLARVEELEYRKRTAADKYRHHYLGPSTKKSWGFWRFLLLSAPLVLVLLGVSGFVGVLSRMRSGELTPSQPTGADWALLAQLFSTPFWAGPLLAFVWVVLHNRSLDRDNQRREAQDRQTHVWVQAAVADECAQIDAELAPVVAHYQERFAGWWPERFLNSEDVEACRRIVGDRRASTVEDAINRYLTDQHELYLRNAAAAQVAEQQRATKVSMVTGVINAALLAGNMHAVASQGAQNREAMAQQASQARRAAAQQAQKTRATIAAEARKIRDA